MACHADPSIQGNINDWLDQFEMFSIYEILPEILELWGSNLFTDISQGKKLARTTRELTTPLFLLRCCEIAIPPRDEKLFTIGLIIDMMTEKVRDGKDYPVLAGQAQFDAF